ncbi:MAG: hypothetical protein ABI818_10235 [Acidobacteriota bacterium]
MGIADWMRVIDTVSGLAQATGRLRSRPAPDAAVPAGDVAQAPGNLEARMAGVVVAALKEAFDRDRARMELERSQVEAERRRADEALAAELKRQAGDRALGQLRILAVMAIVAWMLSAVLAAWLPGMRAGIPRTLLGAGWFLSFATIGCAFAGYQRISAWAASATPAYDAPQSGAASMAPWALLLALGAIASSLLVAI